jgi:DNA polymerase IV
MSELRKIIHVDMDAFFASVEQRDFEQYQGKPIAVGARPDQRGVVAAASYEVRQYGVHSALPSRIAQQRCPHLIFVSPRFEVYRDVSEHIREIFHRYTDLVEPLSLDEAYLDVTQNKLGVGSAMAIARDIKQAIQHETRLTASAGVSINKFLAKMASGMDKPDGLYLIAPEGAAAFVASLPIARFHGVGRATATKMATLGIHTGSDLKQWSEVDLVKHFGKVGSHYYRIARAEDQRLVNPHRVRKSIGAERSFAEDLAGLEAMGEALARIAGEVVGRMEKHGRYGYTLTLKVKYEDYQQVTRAQTADHLLNDQEAIYSLAIRLLQDHLDRSRKVRLLGITISNLAEPSLARRYQQLHLRMPPFFGG